MVGGARIGPAAVEVRPQSGESLQTRTGSAAGVLRGSVNHVNFRIAVLCGFIFVTGPIIGNSQGHGVPPQILCHLQQFGQNLALCSG